MDSFVKKFIRQSSHYAIGEVFVMLSGFISFPILTRVFSPSEYGVLSLISITLWILLAFAKGGLQEAAIRYYPEYTSSREPNREKIFYSSLFYGSVTFGLLAAGIVLLCGGWVLPALFGEDLSDFVWLLAGLVVSGSIFMRLQNFIRAEQRTKFLNLILVVSRYLSLVLSIALIFLVSKSLRMYYAGVLIAEFTVCLLLILLLIKRVGLHPRNVSYSFLGKCLLFGFPLIGFELGHFLIKSADRYVIQILMGAEAVGIFSAAANMCLYLKDLILYPLMYSITPIYVEIWNKSGPAATSAFISKVARICMIIIIPALFGFVALGKDLIVILASERFQSASPLIALIIPGTVIWGLSPIYAAGLYIEKKTKTMTSIVLMGVVLNVGLNFFLIPKLGLIGAAFSTLVSYLLPSIALTVIAARILPIKIDLPTATKTLLASVIMYLVIRALAGSIGILPLAAKVLLGTLVYALAFLALHRADRQRFFEFLAGRFSILKGKAWNSVGD